MRKPQELAAQFERLHEYWQRAEKAGPVGHQAYLYQQRYLPDYVLTNSDRVAALNSVELRTPFLSPELVKTLNSLPDSIKMKGSETKSLLKLIAKKYLPAEITSRKKMGFTAPVALLIKNELKSEIIELLGPSHLKKQGLFESSYVSKILDEHFSNRHNHYKKIWGLYMLQKWLRAQGDYSL